VLHRAGPPFEASTLALLASPDDGNKAEATRRLGVHRRLLYEKTRKLGLDAADQPLEDESLDSTEDP